MRVAAARRAAAEAMMKHVRSKRWRSPGGRENRRRDAPEISLENQRPAQYVFDGEVLQQRTHPVKTTGG